MTAQSVSGAYVDYALVRCSGGMRQELSLFSFIIYSRASLCTIFSPASLSAFAISSSLKKWALAN
jgi:hypothetical protein